jgi:hypothetical protein
MKSWSFERNIRSVIGGVEYHRRRFNGKHVRNLTGRDGWRDLSISITITEQKEKLLGVFERGHYKMVPCTIAKS